MSKNRGQAPSLFLAATGAINQTATLPAFFACLTAVVLALRLAQCNPALGPGDPVTWRKAMQKPIEACCALAMIVTMGGAQELLPHIVDDPLAGEAFRSKMLVNALIVLICWASLPGLISTTGADIATWRASKTGTRIRTGTTIHRPLRSAEWLWRRYHWKSTWSTRRPPSARRSVFGALAACVGLLVVIFFSLKVSGDLERSTQTPPWLCSPSPAQATTTPAGAAAFGISCLQSPAPSAGHTATVTTAPPSLVVCRSDDQARRLE